ncbi:hypothetical protein [Arthrobacter globiformis]|uniref:hypothetical protein n=1 Tax=Arthrobacter globiformis TaxID=1665 RepID=UPI00278B5F2A|nr:hypothetical protein [Arthrobacter globiformis]MDQ0866557.1 hypothetical protein [Arthrobacter globiformis]
MSAARSIASVFLRRAGLFSLVLALITGIFGMHVMNGHHTMHGPASALTVAESAGHSHPAGGAAHGVAADAAHAPSGEQISAEAGCPDGNCSGTQAMTVSCTPSGKTDTLAVPVPGTAAAGAAFVRAGPAGQVSGRSAYRPDTPSPCELSISRT